MRRTCLMRLKENHEHTHTTGPHRKRIKHNGPANLDDSHRGCDRTGSQRDSRMAQAERWGVMPEQKPKPELLPCPFCGGEAKIVDLPEEYNIGGVAVECQKCRASSTCCFPVKDDPKPHVIAAWNTRPVSELERLAREVVESRCEVESTKIYSSARVVANRKAANAFGALVAFLGPSQKGKV